MTYKTLAEIATNDEVGFKEHLNPVKNAKWEKCFRHNYYKLRKYNLEMAQKIVFKENEKNEIFN